MVSPNFLVAGAARSGTTAVVEGLRAHPDAFITRPKEPHYFAFHDRRVDFRGPGDEQRVNRVAVTDRRAYLDLYAQADGRLARGDGSVTTLYYADHAVEEIRHINSQMRAVVILRDPVERSYSSFAYLRSRGVEPEADFRVALSLETERRAKNWHHLWHYTAMSKYAADLGILIDVLGRDRVGVWFYEDLAGDYSTTLAQIAAFLGLSPFVGAGPMVPTVNASGEPRSRALQSAVEWATDHQRVRGLVKATIPFRARERIRKALLRKSAVPANVHDQLRPVFADDLRRLAPLIDRPLPPWLARP